MKISPQASLPGGVKVSNGDSGSDQEQEKKIIVTDLGTNFTVDFRDIELGEQRKAIPSDIINAILARARMVGSSSPADSMDPNIESADSMDPNIEVKQVCWTEYRYGQYI
jgi:hypothetical protein